jgi:hypothetical protein
MQLLPNTQGHMSMMVWTNKIESDIFLEATPQLTNEYGYSQ